MQNDDTDGIPFSLKLILLFLVFDNAKRALLLAGLFLGEADYEVQLILFHALWIMTNCLLIVLINLRANAARYWLMLVISVHALYLVSHIAVREPVLWLVLDYLGRLRLITSLVIDCFILHVLTKTQISNYLVE